MNADGRRWGWIWALVVGFGGGGCDDDVPNFGNIDYTDVAQRPDARDGGETGGSDAGRDVEAVDGPAEVEVQEDPEIVEEVVDINVDLPDGPAPVRSCLTRLEYDATRHGATGSVFFASEANGWSTSTHPMDGEAGLFSLEIALEAGSYGYKFVREGTDWILDPANPYRVTVDGIENSLLIVADCDVPLLEVVEQSIDFAAGRVSWRVAVQDASEGAGIDLDSLEISVNREPVAAADLVATASAIYVEIDGLEPGRYTLRARVADLNGAYSELLHAPVWLEEEPFDWRDAVMYFAFVDRFRNGDTGNDEPRPAVAELVNWQGGDWAGLLAAIEAGYFDALGVNALWITAPNDNPDGVVIGDDGRERSAYHGYFPAEARETENHFGTLGELQAVVDAAHGRGIRVLVDLVANHVYDTHPYYTDRASDADFNQDALCRDINWSRPLTCWFEPYLPDLATSRRALVERLVEDAWWWIEAADLDGFRLDAVKHMDHDVGYLLRAVVDGRIAGDDEFLMVGETFVGTWSEGTANELLDYVSPGELSSQFHFPLYWELVRTVARREAGFEGFQSLDSVVVASEQRFGTASLMSTFAGNHDVARFTSHAAGDIGDMWGNGAKEQSFTDPPDQPTGVEPYERMALALTLILTLPGIPLVYCGDEVGLAGAGDPDNRRTLPEDGDLGPHQLSVREHMGVLGALRAERLELRRGSRATLRADDVYVYARSIGDRVTLVMANNSNTAQSVDVAVSTWLDDGVALTDRVEGGTVTVAGGRVVTTVGPRQSRVWTTP